MSLNLNIQFLQLGGKKKKSIFNICTEILLYVKFNKLTTDYELATAIQKE